MKVVILAGGLGTRLSEETASVPKPMVSIGNLPILVHIMRHYYFHGFKEFVILLGNKGNLIKEYGNIETNLKSIKDIIVETKTKFVMFNQSVVSVALVKTVELDARPLKEFPELGFLPEDTF